MMAEICQFFVQTDLFNKKGHLFQGGLYVLFGIETFSLWLIFLSSSARASPMCQNFYLGGKLFFFLNKKTIAFRFNSNRNMNYFHVFQLRNFFSNKVKILYQ